MPDVGTDFAYSKGFTALAGKTTDGEAREGDRPNDRIKQWSHPQFGYSRLMRTLQTQFSESEDGSSEEDFSREFGSTHFSKTRHFNYAIGIVIACNAIAIGVWADIGDTPFLTFLDYIFLAIYIVEYWIRAHGRGQAFICSCAGIFDAVLIICGLLDMFLPLNGEVLTLLRIARVFRIVRLFQVFPGLNLLLSALVSSIYLVLWIILIMVVFMYILAVILTIAIDKHPRSFGDDEEQVMGWFGSVASSMQTLFIVMTLAAWDEILVTLQKHLDPFTGFVLLAVTMCYIIVAGYAVMSMMTGVMCDALSAASREMEKQQGLAEKNEYLKAHQELTRRVIKALNELDLDGDGMLTVEEVKMCLEGDTSIFANLHELDIDLTPEDLDELLEQLYTTSSSRGAIVSIQEVCNTLCNLTGHATAYSVMHLKHQMLKMEGELVTGLKKNDGALQEVNMKLDKVMAALNIR